MSTTNKPTTATETPLGAYAGTPHKTIEELVAMATSRAIAGEVPGAIIQDIVDGYSLGWQSANHQLIEQAARNPLTMSATIKAGDTLEARSLFDYSCVYLITIISRTAKMAKYTGWRNGTSKIKRDSYGEYIEPERYSMAPRFRAKEAK